MAISCEGQSAAQLALRVARAEYRGEEGTWPLQDIVIANIVWCTA